MSGGGKKRAIWHLRPSHYSIAKTDFAVIPSGSLSMATWRGRARGREHHVVGRIRVFGESVFFGESGLLENEPTVARAEQAHTTLRQFFFTHCAPPCGVTCVCLFCGCRWFILNVLINHITLSEKINPFPKNTSHNQHLCEAKRGGHWPFFAAFAAFDFFFASSLNSILFTCSG